MADTDKSTLQTILENLRDAGMQFGQRFSDPTRVRPELIKLLAELGIADPIPGNAVSSAMEHAAAVWAAIADQLKTLDFNFLDPIAAVRGLSAIGETIAGHLADMARLPASTVAALGAGAADIAQVLPERLLGYIVFEFVTKSHPKIGGAFLLLGVLRREFMPAGGKTALTDAQVRVFDVAQLVRVVTHPREAMLQALKWGRDDFDSQTVVDGVSLLLGLLADAGVVFGPEVDSFPPIDESSFVGRSVAELAALRTASARRTIQLPKATTLSLVGLHRDGFGLMATNPVNISGGVGSLHLPSLGPGLVLALSAGTPPETADPRVRLLP